MAPTDKEKGDFFGTVPVFGHSCFEFVAEIILQVSLERISRLIAY